jgi:hypothetical protein
MRSRRSRHHGPARIYHGTDALSAAIIQRVGFREASAFEAANRTEPGYVYGTTEPDYAEVYAKKRAEMINAKEGVVLEVDTRGLDVQNDPTVAVDSLYDIAYRVPLPVGPERVKVHKRVPRHYWGWEG